MTKLKFLNYLVKTIVIKLVVEIMQINFLNEFIHHSSIILFFLPKSEKTTLFLALKAFH